LLRTSPSCGDGRLFWENAGEQNFNFVLAMGPADWQAGSTPRRAETFLRPPVARWFSSTGNGAGLPATDSFFHVSGRAVLSCLYPAKQPGQIAARLWNPSSQPAELRLSGILVEGQAQKADLLESPYGSLNGANGDWTIDLPAWGIQTILLTHGGPLE
jgi:alpha-mannosidase